MASVRIESASPPPPFEEWCLLELFGRTRFAGKVSETTLAGGSFLRIDIPREKTAEDPREFTTRFYGPGAIFGITPISERAARAFAEQHQLVPIEPWDLPALPAVARRRGGPETWATGSPMWDDPIEGDEPEDDELEAIENEAIENAVDAERAYRGAGDPPDEL